MFTNGEKKIVIMAVAFIAIVVVSVLVYNWRKKEAFCGTCQGIGNKVCPNRELIHKLYNDGKLTEFTTPERNNKQWPVTYWDNFFDQENNQN